MTREAQNIDDIRNMANEIARLMGERFGGVKRGEFPRLSEMLRRRGGALPRKQRRLAKTLAAADLHSAQPKIARQTDLAGASRAYRSLTAHLEPLGQVGRWKNKGVNFVASVVFGLLVLAAVIIWLLLQQGYIGST